MHAKWAIPWNDKNDNWLLSAKNGRCHLFIYLFIYLFAFAQSDQRFFFFFFFFFVRWLSWWMVVILDFKHQTILILILIRYELGPSIPGILSEVWMKYMYKWRNYIFLTIPTIIKFPCSVVSVTQWAIHDSGSDVNRLRDWVKKIIDRFLRYNYWYLVCIL